MCTILELKFALLWKRMMKKKIKSILCILCDYNRLLVSQWRLGQSDYSRERIKVISWLSKFRNFDSIRSVQTLVSSLVGFHARVHASLRIRLVTHPVHATMVSFCQPNWRCEPRHVLQRPRENNTCLHTAVSHSLTTRCHCPRGTSSSCERLAFPRLFSFSPSSPSAFYTSSSSFSPSLISPLPLFPLPSSFFSRLYPPH